MSLGVEAFEDERYELAVSGCRHERKTGRIDNGSASLTRQPGLGYEAVQWLVHLLHLSKNLEKVGGWRQTTTHHFDEHEHEPLSSVSQLRISSSTSWRGPSQVVHIKHEHNVGLVGNLAQLVDVVPPRLLFHLATPNRDTANRMLCMAVVDVSHASDESVGSGAVIASLCRGSRGEGWADRIGAGKVGEVLFTVYTSVIASTRFLSTLTPRQLYSGWRVEPAVVFERNTSDRKSGQRRSGTPMSSGEQNTKPQAISKIKSARNA
ncbi:hypothetical protein EDB85DRAFT_2280924 [Lactarius pseudohatsudake]|nr:hypothetical protein EDB85DRAFT_2280924 [Lactarius pseudohatsudake]